MSVDAKLAPAAMASCLPDDRRHSYTDFEIENSQRVARPQVTSQNGLASLPPDSDIPKGVNLRRAKSLRDSRKEVRPKRYSVNFDLPVRGRSYDADIDISALSGPQAPPKPPRANIPEEDEDEDEVREPRHSSAFNSVALRKSLADGLEKVRRLSGIESDPSRASERRTSRENGAYVKYRNEDGDWQQHKVRRVSQFEACDFTFKVMLIGDSCVGKTCILTRFKDGTFLSGSFISTIGIDFRNKVVTVDGSKVKLQIWDTAGQERFRSVTHAYYRDAHALLLLYDVMSKTSFDNTRAWLGEVAFVNAGLSSTQGRDGERVPRLEQVALDFPNHGWESCSYNRSESVHLTFLICHPISLLPPYFRPIALHEHLICRTLIPLFGVR
ncbi:uncharacterized protein LOC134762236 [Penaeus indicus]|uniref:uncharacterized protein LOC134762236 n=1 Tax=Penaeus indicus TaxID=29960 RepID=UPI00300CD86D